MKPTKEIIFICPEVVIGDIALLYWIQQEPWGPYRSYRKQLFGYNRTCIFTMARRWTGAKQQSFSSNDAPQDRIRCRRLRPFDDTCVVDRHEIPSTLLRNTNLCRWLHRTSNQRALHGYSPKIWSFSSAPAHIADHCTAFLGPKHNRAGNDMKWWGLFDELKSLKEMAVVRAPVGSKILSVLS